MMLRIYGITTSWKKIKRSFWTARVKRHAGACGSNLAVNYKSTVNQRTYLGNHVNFNGMRILGSGECHIGDYFHSGFECLILTENHNYDHGEKIPYDETRIAKDVEIEDFVWLGDRVTVLPGVHIGRGAVIQAGGVVSGDIPECAVAGGNPAKVYKYRDKEHFHDLLDKGAYF